jgi:cytoskeleton protein RodZ
VQATGIGPALRKARLLRGKSIEEASRETRIRADYLSALERERFDALLGEVYVRGFLRSYSSYLGLDSDKVLTVYNRHFGQPASMEPKEAPEPPLQDVAGRHQLPSLRGRSLSGGLLVSAAVIALVAFAAAGLFSRSKTAPPPATIPGSQATTGVLPQGVMVAVQALTPVHVTVLVDGKAAPVFDRILRDGEGETFEGSTQIEIHLDHGASAVIVVNGHPLGSPGSSKEPYSATFVPTDFRATPSPHASATGSTKATASARATSPSTAG